MTIVGFTGTRNGMSKEQKAFLRKFFEEEQGIEKFIHGDCIGADAQAHTIAFLAGVPIFKRPCNIGSLRAFCSNASETADPEKPLDRNKKIVDDCSILVAMPFEHEELRRSGTWSTIRYARKTGKKILVVFPDGTSSEET